MLQEWLEELAEDEMKKTASSQFEEVLHEMDIPELKAFFEMNQGLEKSAQDPAVPDPAAGGELPFGFERVPEQTMRRPAFGGGMSSLDPNLAEAMARREMRGSAVLGGIGSGLAGGLAGAGYGASLGGARGALLGGLGGAALAGGGAYGLSRALEPLAVQQARKGAIEDRDLLEQIQAGTKKAPLMSRLEEQLQGTPESMKYAAAQDPEGTYNKIKQAADAGRALAQLGFVPKVIEPSFGKEAQAPVPEPVDPRVQAAAMRGGAIGGGLQGAIGGAAQSAGYGLGGAALGAGVGGLAGAGLGTLAGRIHESEYAQRHPVFGRAVAPLLVGGLGGLGGAVLGAGQERARQAKLEEQAAGTPEAMPKQASFRDTILKVASDGNLPQNHGWEL